MEALIAEHYGLRGLAVTRIARGHTNESFAIGDRFVARRSWAGKPLARIEREERVLAEVGVPRIVRTKSGALHVRTRDRFVHVFERCAGDPGPMWLAREAVDLVRSSMETLAELHTRLARIELTERGSWSWLHERLERVRAGPLPEHGARVLARIEGVLEAAPSFGDVQWLHGDYHLGNLLVDDGAVSAVVDFDDTAPGSAAGEAAMALFALSRQDRGEERFVWDEDLWEAGRKVYPAHLPPPDVLVPIFCAHQVLVHLEAAQRGWWRLEPGIGFWPCWNHLT